MYTYYKKNHFYLGCAYLQLLAGYTYIGNFLRRQLPILANESSEAYSLTFVVGSANLIDGCWFFNPRPAGEGVEILSYPPSVCIRLNAPVQRESG